ncbi:MAG: nucleotidyltransferase [Nitrospirota bacterium]
MGMQLLPSLHKAISLLEDNGYRYAVIGGLAVSTWGWTRATYDVDIKVLVPDTDYSSIRAIRAIIRSAFSERARPHVQENPLIVDTKIDEVIVDFLLTVPGYEENITTHAISCDINGLKVWICSPEDLIIQKAVAGRPQDWQDIEGILNEQYGQLNVNYIKDWLKEFAEVLARPEMLKQYQHIQGLILNARGNVVTTQN